MINQAPVLLMTYIRPKTTELILNLLVKYKQRKIFVFNDGLKYATHKKQHTETRKIILKFKKKKKF